MRIAVVIVNYRTPEMVLTCLDALAGERAAVSGLRVVVVDNASPDHSATFLATHLAADAYAGWVEFLPLPLNGGFAWGNNQAILSLVQADAPADAILLLNPDAVIQPGALGALVRDMEARADAGAVGSQLINPDGTLSGSAFRFPSIGSEFVRGTGLAKVGRVLGIKPTMVPFGEVGPVDWLTGASVLIRVEALRQAGLFDTGFFLYFEEVELMHRIVAAGWKCYHCPASRVLHVAGASTGVVNGKATGSRVPPDYVFTARKRYFALVSGRTAALAAGLAWLCGGLVGQAVAWLRGQPYADEVVQERAALLRLGLSAPPSAARQAISRISDAPGQPPAWMQ